MNTDVGIDVEATEPISLHAAREGIGTKRFKVLREPVPVIIRMSRKLVQGASVYVAREDDRSNGKGPPWGHVIIWDGPVKDYVCRMVTQVGFKVIVRVHAPEHLTTSKSIVHLGDEGLDLTARMYTGQPNVELVPTAKFRG